MPKMLVLDLGRSVSKGLEVGNNNRLVLETPLDFDKFSFRGFDLQLIIYMRM